MQHITQKLQDKFYTYQPGEFLPIYEGGVLLNRREFMIYKLKSIVRK